MSDDVTHLKDTALTDDQAKGVGMSAEEMEEHFKRHMQEGGITRRGLFAAVAMDARELAKNIQKADDNGKTLDAFLDLAECAGEEINWFKSHVKLMESGQARVLWALSQCIDEQEGEQ